MIRLKNKCVTSFQTVATLRDYYFPVLHLFNCGLILLGKRVWSAKTYQEVSPFQSVASLRTNTFPILYLRHYNLVILKLFFIGSSKGVVYFGG